MEQPKKLVIVTGATGKTGYFIVKRLVEKNYIVRIITRNYESAKKTFGPELFQKLDTPVICNLAAEAKALESKIMNNTVKNSLLDFAFEKGPEGQKPSLIVSAQGRNRNTSEEVKHIEFVSLKLLINLAKKHQIEKFALVSSMCITRPYNFITLLLNTIVKDVLYWKSRAENELRASGLNYIICRPGVLAGEQQNSRTTGYTIGQGDTFNEANPIQRNTVGTSLVDMIEDQETPNKFTYEIVATKAQNSEQYNYSRYKFIPDQDDQQPLDSEKMLSAKRNVFAGIFLFFLAIILYFFVL